MVDNAGMLMNGIAESFTPDQFLSILDTNAVSWLRFNRVVLPVLRSQGHGTIVYWQYDDLHPRATCWKNEVFLQATLELG